MTETNIVLEAHAPEALLMEEMHGEVWIRNIGLWNNWVPLIEIKGNFDDVYEFVSLNWGKEEADYRLKGIETSDYP
jgi:hypothetical protein